MRLRYLKPGQAEWIEEDVNLCPDCRLVVQGNISGHIWQAIENIVGPSRKRPQDGGGVGYAQR